MSSSARLAISRRPSDGQQLLYRSGRQITHGRYDHLWSRLDEHLSWVATQQLSTHWLRPTTLTWVKCNFGHAGREVGMVNGSAASRQPP
jgi:hypothetical protein